MSRAENWSKPTRAAILLAGILLGQALQYGPSLLGAKVLLPLDILARPGVYLPRTPEVKQIEPKNRSLSDPLYMFEPARLFAVTELRAGRLPVWMPYEYAGSPFILPKFSPFVLPGYCLRSPVVLAWAQLLVAFVAGTGAYAFCRRVLQLSFWPATVAGWCYPLTGFFVFWQSYPTAGSVPWLPWLVMAVERSARKPSALTVAALSGVTCLTLISGNLDVGAQVLLGSGLYAVWALLDGALACHSRPGAATSARSSSSSPTKAEAATLAKQPTGTRIINPQLEPSSLSPSEADSAGRKEVRGEQAISRKGVNEIASIRSRLVIRGGAAIILGWLLGFMLAAPCLLPVLEYTKTGIRMSRRAGGAEERPPAGLSALPQAVLPYMYGMMQKGSIRFAPENEVESSAATYSGLIATLLVAPLAWCSRRHRSFNVFSTAAIVFALSWCLKIPGFVQLLRLPGLNMMSHNRLVFIASFAIIAMMAIGLEVFLSGPQPDRSGPKTFHASWWRALPAVALVILFAWCVFRSFQLPGPAGAELEATLAEQHQIEWIHDLAGVRQAQEWFSHYYIGASVLCVLALGGWVLLWRRRLWQGRLFPVLATLLVGDLLWFAHDRSIQSDPALYFPSVPVLDQIAKSRPGRVMGMDCLPANLGAMSGLRDLRGYDGIDPERIIRLMAIGANPESRAYPYAMTQWLEPKMSFGDNGEIRLSPILDMLDVRFVVFRGEPPANIHPQFQSFDYWAMENPAALGRVFIPERVEQVPNDTAVLQKLAIPDFDARKIAFVQESVIFGTTCRGTAKILKETPKQIILTVEMETPALVVLTDQWDKGWRAKLNDKEVPILRTNHALRGVVVPPGSGTLEFRYRPQSFYVGLLLSAGAVALLTLALGHSAWKKKTAVRNLGVP